MSEEQRPHPAACPCSECKQKIESANTGSGEKFDTSEDSNLRKVPPNVARTLGYTNPKS